MIALPSVASLPALPRRVILHWTGGVRVASSYEKRRYNFLIEQDLMAGGRWVEGVPLARNMGSKVGTPAAHEDPSGYAAHTGSLNSYSIGIALCGMSGAVDYRPSRPVNPGAYPVTSEQVDVLVEGVAQILKLYDLEAVPEHLFDHWEAHWLHGVKQRQGVWDLQWIPGEELTRGEVGGWLRSRVRDEMVGKVSSVVPFVPWREPPPPLVGGLKLAPVMLKALPESMRGKLGYH